MNKKEKGQKKEQKCLFGKTEGETGTRSTCQNCRQQKAKQGIRSITLRTFSILAIIAIVCIGLAFQTGIGTPSSWGIADIATICPLGAIEIMLAAHTIVPSVIIPFIIVFLVTVILGRAFCSWGCPVPLLRRVFGLKTPDQRRTLRARKHEAKAASSRQTSVGVKEQSEQKVDTEQVQPKQADNTRNWVLGGVLVSSAIFGFPVFCIVCPVGLTFASIVLLWRLFQFNETTLSLVVFPAILIVELVLARKWCHRICPLGALLSLISRFNRMFRPRIDTSVCLHANGQACHRCAQICPEGIDLHGTDTSAPLADCTKCRDCSDECPVHAIDFPVLYSDKIKR